MQRENYSLGSIDEKKLKEKGQKMINSNLQSRRVVKPEYL